MGELPAWGDHLAGHITLSAAVARLRLPLAPNFTDRLLSEALKL